MGLRIADPNNAEDVKVFTDLVFKFTKSVFPDMSDVALKATVDAHLNGPRNKYMVILYDNVGFIAGKVVLSHAGTVTALESGWYVEEEYRGKSIGKELIQAFEFWGKLLECKVCAMGAFTDEVCAFYEKNGYKLYERTYIKSL